MTAPERTEFKVEADQLGVNLNKAITEGEAVGMVLQKLGNRSLAHARIVNAIFTEHGAEPSRK